MDQYTLLIDYSYDIYPIWNCCNIDHLGTLHNILGEYKLAIQMYYNALFFIEKIPSTISKGVLYNHLASVLIVTNQTQQALYYLNQAEIIVRQTNDHVQIANVLINSGNYYLLEQSMNWDKAKSYYTAALTLSKRIMILPVKLLPWPIWAK